MNDRNALLTREITPKGWLGAIAALIVVTLTMCACATQTGPPGTGWITLLDGSSASLDGWNRLGDANWRSEGGLIVADSGGGDFSYIVSKNSYSDLQVWVEFWAASNTNSGVFIRITDPQNITPLNAYEFNIYDDRPDQSYGTGAIVEIAKVNPMPNAAAKWNTFLITAKGSAMALEMNGRQTVSANDARNASGPIAVQFGGVDSGPIKLRKVMVRPL